MSDRRILILEENQRQRMALSSTLEGLGFEVVMALNGNEAALAVKGGRFGMILADFNTPGYSPIEFIQQVKAENPLTQVLFVSDQIGVEDAVTAMKSGAVDVLVKPLESEQLKLSVERIFSQKNRLDRPRPPGRDGKFKTAILTRDPAMERLLGLAQRVADSSASVMIQGESGTGKELFARFIHEKSGRSKMPFVAVNCAALPEALLESELFGHEKGAFTGALSRKPGKFELAANGTLLLDEITEMPFHLQAKLLRVLQEKTLDRVGGVEPVEIDVRVISTTNREIRDAISRKEFREDLYYRLNTIPLILPPLRDRLGDLEILCNFFIRKYRILDARNVKGMTKQALDLLHGQTFAGNIRELENIVHRAVLLTDTDMIGPGDLLMDPVMDQDHEDPGEDNSGFSPGATLSPLKEMEEKMIFHTLDKTDGNRTHAAKILGISVRTLRNKLNEYKKNSIS